MPRPVHKAYVEEFVDSWLGRPFFAATCARTGKGVITWHDVSATAESIELALAHLGDTAGYGVPACDAEHELA